jgi:hypothetical protein
MFWFKKCDHDWHELRYGVVATENGSAITVDLYCPKCNKQKSMFKREWDRKQAIDSIKRKYNKS